MRAAVLKEYGAPLAVEDRADPACPPDGVVLRVLACGVCRSDWHGWSGEHPRVKPGAVLGHEYAGEVVEAAPGTGWTKGDRLVAPFLLSCGVCPACRSGASHTCPDLLFPGLGSSDGAFAEYVAVPRAHDLSRLPEGLAPEEAAGLGCRVMTAWHALTDRAGLRAGEWLSVHGAGGLGSAAILIARAMGARVVAVDVDPEKLRQATELGAEAAVDARDGGAAAAVREITGGGAHVALEAVGVAPAANDGLRALRPLGRYVQAGMPIGHTARMEIDMNAVFMKNLAVFGSRGMPAWRYPSLLDMVQRGAVDVARLIGRRIPLSGVSDELIAMNTTTPPGSAVVTDFAA